MTTILSDQMVAMRDGVRLATDIYLPDGPGPFPVLLERTPYDKTGTNHGDFTARDPEPRSKPEIARWFVEAGYAYVLQDCRGRFASEGVFTKYLREAEDGADTLAWLIDQPWCDGRVGTLGLSYGAHVQNALACLNPPGLAAMFLDSGGFSSAYHGGARQGGAFELKQLTWARKHALQSPETAADPARRAALESEKIEDWIGRRWRIGHSPLAAAPEYEAYIVEQWDNDRLTDFWKQRGIYAFDSYGDYADVPAVHMSSWYDPYSQTAIDNFTALTPIKRGPIKLVLGPWTHGQRSVTSSGDADFGADAVLDGQVGPDYFTLRRDWFDRHMLGRADAPEHLPAPVRIFVMGGGSGRRTAEGRLDHGGRWRDEAAWPLPHVRDVAMYLHGDGGLRAALPATGAAPLSYDFDPADPVPTIGGAITSGAPLMFAGGYDQRETEDLFGARHPGRALAERPDVLVFETEPLAHDTEVTGSVVAALHISSSAVDTDFTIKLVDVYPPNPDYPEGYALNLAHGILRARFRNSFEHPEPLEPDTVHAITIRAFPTSNLFRAGHRIRIEVSSSNFPHFDVNPNSDWRDADAAPVVARNSIFVDRDHPSHIILPIVPHAKG
ncbi:CocE/NonD family hydrolase [Sphingomonas lycopersici]|uniref:CocE/NonD family hydrolase n=1 Tax=Sphingomonas lycopersici TaxID=2951807 RepID=A0AA42CTD5_9SPHN|nr:CocE/NonD family hydrolase [Sphingomonas lycopersici]MCW6534261.1 CocE/NonD family hydrolase [Sphingomonas lycopersici]